MTQNEIKWAKKCVSCFMSHPLCVVFVVFTATLQKHHAFSLALLDTVSPCITQCEEPINNYCAHVMREFTNQKCWNLSTNNEANHCYTRGTLWPLDMQHHRSPRIVWTYPTPRPRNWNPTVTAVNKIYTLARVWISYYQWILSTSINHHWSSIHCQMSFEPWLFLDSPGLAKPSQA